MSDRVPKIGLQSSDKTQAGGKSSSLTQSVRQPQSQKSFPSENSRCQREAGLGWSPEDVLPVQRSRHGRIYKENGRQRCQKADGKLDAHEIRQSF